MNADAFARREPDESGRPTDAQRLRGLLAALRADLGVDGDGWRLNLSPMTPRGMIESWQAMPSLTGAHTVLIDRTGGKLGSALLSEPGLLDRMMPAGGTRWMLALVAGAVESRDLRAMHEAVHAGRSVFDAEFRTVLSACMSDAHGVTYAAQDGSYLVAILGRALRLYVASLLRTDPDLLASPPDALVHQLLVQSGSLCIRPIESQVSSTAIDIGVDTTGGSVETPANESVVYDIYGNSWHRE